MWLKCDLFNECERIGKSGFKSYVHEFVLWNTVKKKKIIVTQNVKFCVRNLKLSYGIKVEFLMCTQEM